MLLVAQMRSFGPASISIGIRGAKYCPWVWWRARSVALHREHPQHTTVVGRHVMDAAACVWRRAELLPPCRARWQAIDHIVAIVDQQRPVAGDARHLPERACWRPIPGVAAISCADQ